MKTIEISSEFTIDDIHKIREYNYEMTKNMSFEEMRDYYDKGASVALELMAKLKKEKQFVML